MLTSLSEAQPLVILEAGAAGVISVATNVGSCSELILGKHDEEPKLGPGGEICPLANPKAVAEAVAGFLQDKEKLNAARDALRERTRLYYNRIDQHKAYRELYEGLINQKKAKV